jgi:ABC-type phosphate transport system auxiliary subunit
MNWERLQFSATDVIRIVIQVVLGAVFIMMMKSDIKMISDGLIQLKQDRKEDRDLDRAWKTKVEAEYGEMKIRISLLEQKVTDLQIKRDSQK